MAEAGKTGRINMTVENPSEWRGFRPGVFYSGVDVLRGAVTALYQA